MNTNKAGGNRAKLILLAVVAAAFVAAPFIFRNNDYILNILIVCLVWATIAESWNLILGYADVFSFAQICFWVIGAYTTAILTKFYGWNPWLGILLGGLTSTTVGIVIALPCLRLKGIYVGLVTFSIQLVLPTLIVLGSRLDLPSGATTGGSYGLSRIPALNLFGYQFDAYHLIPWYFVALVFFAVFMLLIYIIIHSKLGLAFMALRDSKPMAKALGVDEYKYKIYVFAISAFIAGTIGAFYAHYLTSISTASLGLEPFLLCLVMVVMGGMGRYPGAALGAFIVKLLDEALRSTLTFRLVIMGLIIIVVMTYLPNGVMGLLETLKKYALRYTRKLAERKKHPAEQQ